MRFAILVAALLSLATAWVPRELASIHSPEEADTFKFRRALLEQMQEVVEYLTEEILETTEYDVLMEELEEIYNNPGSPSVDCGGCMALITTVRGFLNQGLDYWDVRDPVINICYDLVNSSEPGSRYDVICPGACDIYGPHVMYIINVTDDSARDICTLFNNCDPVHELERKRETPGDHELQAEVPSRRQPHKRRQLKTGQPNVDGAIKLAHLTDIHVDELYLEGESTECGLPVCCREGYPGAGMAEYWGEYQCNIPPYTVELLLQFVADLEPDIVIYTGDSPPNDVWAETQDRQINVTRWVAEVIDKHFPGIPAYSNIGNHEPFPTNLYYSPRPQIQEFNFEFGKYWTEMSRFTEEQLETVNQAGYFSVLAPDFPGLRIISYNTNYGYTDNFYGPLLQEDIGLLDMKEYVESELANARENGEKVLFVAHHKSGEGSNFMFFSRWVSDLAIEYGDIILLHIMGHSHRDDIKMTTDLESGEVFNVQMCAPAITTRGTINPSARIFYLDPETYLPLDYDQYNIDLDEAMESDEEPEVRLFYKASEEYDMPDLTPASYGDFVDRMEVDQDLFEKYRYFELTGARTPGPCTGECKDNVMCSLRTTAYEEYKRCIGDWP